MEFSGELQELDYESSFLADWRWAKGMLLAGFLGWASFSRVSGIPTNNGKDCSGLRLKGV